MQEIKQAIIVRTDLKMGRGKIAAQVGHACVLGTERAKSQHPDWYHDWWSGQKKVVLKVNGLKELDKVKKHAIHLNLSWFEVSDAGHTQVEPGTITCLAIGPAPEDIINKVTGHLKLL